MNLYVAFQYTRDVPNADVKCLCKHAYWEHQVNETTIKALLASLPGKIKIQLRGGHGATHCGGFHPVVSQIIYQQIRLHAAT